MNSRSILLVESIRKSFIRNTISMSGDSIDERYHIIDDLDMEVPEGKITALIGGNGAGKTTLFNIISGFVSPDYGEILFRENDKVIPLTNMSPHNRTRLGIGRMFQDTHIFPNMTVMENMLIASSETNGEQPFVSLAVFCREDRVEKKRISKAREIFETLFGQESPLWLKRNEPATSLSFGQQRLLGLARLFMGDYSLVLLDEPTAGVSPQLIPQIITIIRFFVEFQGITVFLIEHNMKVVQELADFCTFMSHGRITAFGTPEDVIGNPEVRKAYMGV